MRRLTEALGAARETRVTQRVTPNWADERASAVVRRCAACAVALLAMLLGTPRAPFAQGAATSAPPASAPPAFIWALTAKKGDVFRYKLHQMLSGVAPKGSSTEDEEDFQAEITSIIRREVITVSPEGDITFKETTEARRRTVNGRRLKEIPSAYSVIKQTMTRSGLVRAHEVESVNAGKDRLAELSKMLSERPSPGTPIHFGETWQTDRENRVAPGTKVAYLSRLIGREKVLNRETLRVALDLEIPTVADAGPLDTMRVKSFYNIDPKTGLLVRANYDVDNVEMSVGQGSIKVTAHSTIELLVAGINDKEPLGSADEGQGAATSVGSGTAAPVPPGPKGGGTK